MDDKSENKNKYEKNIYEILTDQNIDSYVLNRSGFVLRPHQIIPKYYIQSTNINKIILHYSMGSGKTSTAVMAFLNKFNNISKTFTVRSMLGIQNKDSDKIPILVVGGWQTKSQIEIELMRPEFRVIDQNKMKMLKILSKNQTPEGIMKYEDFKKSILKTIEQIVRFMGYQMLFNAVFPTFKQNQYSQNIITLEYAYETGELVPSPNFLKQIQGGIIIVDEMQNLYSNLGLNTYGFVIKILAKLCDEYDFKMIFMSGTMINSNVGELCDICDIISGNTITREEYCYRDTFFKDYQIWRLKKARVNDIINILFKNVIIYSTDAKVASSEIISIADMINKYNIYYPITPQTKSSKSTTKRRKNKWLQIYKKYGYFPNIVEQSSMIGGKSIKEPPIATQNEHINKFDIRTQNVKAIVIKSDDNNLPIEIHVGNTLIEHDKQSLMLYAIEATDLQLTEYNSYINKQSKNSDIYDINNTEINSSIISIHDACIPPKAKWIDYRLYINNNTIMGDILHKNNIGKISGIAHEMLGLCFNNAYNNEKTVVYHNKINNFGIIQYMMILKYNGCIRYGESPVNDSICKYCRQTYKDHFVDAETKIKNNICNKFKGIYIAQLIGDVNQKDRDNIVNNVYNTPQNIWGDLISIIFVSDVAYSGVSFFNTNNILILSRVPNMSKWKQIYSRVIRTQSHQLLPVHKRYVKIYTMIIYSPTVEKNDTSYNYMYYKLRMLLYSDINVFMKQLSKNNIGNIMLKEPKKMIMDEKEHEIAESIFISDVNNEIKNVFDKLRNKVSNYWKLSTLIARLKENKNMLSFINMQVIPDDVVYGILLNNRVIKTFKYEYSDELYVELYGVPVFNRTNVLSYFKFNQLKTIDTRKTNFNNTMKSLEEAHTLPLKIQHISNTIHMLKGKYTELIDRTVFWDAIYDIHDEYYDDDDVNFVYNHCRENRNRETFSGCYYGHIIILKNGTSRNINFLFHTLEKKNPYPYLFKITCLSFSEYSPFYLHVNIIKVEKNTHTDKRKIRKGKSCTSFEINKIAKYFPTLDISKKKTFCSELIFELCALQNADKDSKFVMIPFEK
jgi:hypothetical protein